MEPAEWIQIVLCSIVLATWVFHFLGFQILAIIYARIILHKPLRELDPEDLEGVSILKPLTGVDDNLFDNLKTFFTLEYPKYELLFCVQDESDPSIMVVTKLMETYPNVDVSLFIGGKTVGVNPKVNNMMPGYEAAKHPFVMISDSGLRMQKDTLQDFMGTMKESDKVGLVHQLPFVCHRKGFAGVYEKVFFGTQHPKLYLSANAAGFVCVTGMSSMMRKELIDLEGGLGHYADYIAEDFYIARDIRWKGYEIRMAHSVAEQNSGHYSIETHNKRLIRWARVRFGFMPHTIILEPLIESVLLGILVSWAAYHLLDFSPVAIFFVHMLIWFICDYILMITIEKDPLPFSKWEFVMAWLFREFTSITIHLRANSDPHVQWRENKIRLKWGGKGVLVKRPVIDEV